ncbi:ATP-dependent DNA helicase RecG [Natronobacillus azotifigens]|uniref:ATP-dependent DNA helicase RecG n=1 Tax=Natronobacillus azotifigens TaxID=472978 RepID=A0A9J6RCW7_9BACI|nr:ATP-dependent DNA helicase RecG [Natronobacillus azotifigens]
MIERSVDNIKGVGPALQEQLETLNIFTVEDLLFFFPSRYDNYQVKPLNELIHDEKATIEGEVIGEPIVTYYGPKKSRLTVHVQVEQVVIKAIMFNRAFAKKHLQPGEMVTLTGKWDQHRLQITVTHYKKGQANVEEPIQPVYSLKQVIKSTTFKKAVHQALEQYYADIVEILPDEFLTEYKLLNRRDAIKEIHFPSEFEMVKQAKRRMIYEELLLFQLKMQQLRKLNRERTTGNSQQYHQEKVTNFIQLLPFELTQAQQRSLSEILTDLKSPYRMHRLLQGDVGSGKTAVAAIILYASITAGNQGALMVPTEILAEQHYQSFVGLFADFGNVELLTGSIKGKKRKESLQRLQNGQIDILIGTHALIQDEVHFAKLGTVVVDEQHRFGVNQRKALRAKGMDPDVLFMTATPIPRTLAITSYGDMDVSQIDQMPIGRKPIETFWVKESMLPRILRFIEKEINQGHQAYVICPLIEESEKLDIQNAVELYHQLQTTLDNKINVGLLHGRLSNEEKEIVMQQYANNELQVLVATTVVEVGVNVPNATVMVVYDAERFGLSQLHQLRGRVGRSDVQSYCILIADPKGDIGKERMRIMTETTNGFELAEQDLELRGPGDFFGKKQSGLPEFQLADIVHDYRALETARNDAQTIIYDEKLENDPKYQALKSYLEKELMEKSTSLD